MIRSTASTVADDQSHDGIDWASIRWTDCRPVDAETEKRVLRSFNRGSGRKRRLLPVDAVELAERMLAEKCTMREIAARTGISVASVSSIKSGRLAGSQERLHLRRERLRESGPCEVDAATAERCPTCGAMVTLPCRACDVRHHVDTFGRTAAAAAVDDDDAETTWEERVSLGPAAEPIDAPATIPATRSRKLRFKQEHVAKLLPHVLDAAVLLADGAAVGTVAKQLHAHRLEIVRVVNWIGEIYGVAPADLRGLRTVVVESGDLRAAVKAYLLVERDRRRSVEP